MDVIVSPPSYQRKAIKIKLPDSRKSKLKEFRVGLWIDDSLYPPDNDVGNCLQKMVTELTKAGSLLTIMITLKSAPGLSSLTMKH